MKGREAGGQVAFMFQEPALFPWLTAAGNVELALRARGVGKAERRQRTGELLETVHLGGFGGKRPHQLSGGMRQRVALARALAQDADVLLMDEPFGALDAMTRDVLHDELDRICADRRLTVLFVTHNVREAVRLGDRGVVLSSRPGRVIDEFAVPIQRPRRIDSAPVAELAARITDRLREEMSRMPVDGRVNNRTKYEENSPGWSPSKPRRRRNCAVAGWRPRLDRSLAGATRDRYRARDLGAHPPHRLEEVRATPALRRSSPTCGAKCSLPCSGRPSASRCTALMLGFGLRCSSARWSARWYPGSGRCARRSDR